VGGDPHVSTTTSETRSVNAITEPTPDGYRPCWRKINLITKINSYAQLKNEQESEASNLNITRRLSSESQRTTRICACSGVAQARCKTKLKFLWQRLLSIYGGTSSLGWGVVGWGAPNSCLTPIKLATQHLGRF
jgi:hypothetical protein